MAGKHDGAVLGLRIDCFGELPAGFNDVCTFIARNRAVSYMDRYDDKSPKEISSSAKWKPPSLKRPFLICFVVLEEWISAGRASWLGSGSGGLMS